MSSEGYLASLRDSVVSLDFGAATDAAERAMAAGIDPNLAISEGLVPGMVIVGEKFDAGDYFLSELLVAAEVMKDALNVITPYLKSEGQSRVGKVVIATVAGDLHDLGKNIVTTLLRLRGFDVIDLGIDVPTDRILAAVREHRPDVLGLSALLTLTMSKMGEVVEAIKRAGLRDEVRIIVGGSPVTSEFAVSIGADHRAANAVEGVRQCLAWVGVGRED